MKQISYDDQFITELSAGRLAEHSLAQPFYVSPQVFEADFDRVFRRGWLFAGHSCQILKPGDFFTYTVGEDVLIVVRGDDGAVHALFDVCRHRGSRMCLEDAGHVSSFVCPYHQWVYRRDGSLATARYTPKDFPKAEYGMHRARAAELAGLIFINLSPEGEPFDEAREAIGPQLQPHGLERAKVACTLDYEVHANWKLIFENNRECYHCPVGHKEYSHVNFGGIAFGRPDIEEEIQRIHAAKDEQWQRAGLVTQAVNLRPGTWYKCGRSALREDYVSESPDGRPVAPLMGDFRDPDMGSFRIVTFPNFWLHASSDHAMTTRLTPVSASLTRVRVSWLVHAEAREGQDYDLERLTAVWRATSEQDWKLVEANHAGVNSSRYQPGPYIGEIESGVEQFVQWYLDRLALQ